MEKNSSMYNLYGYTFLKKGHPIKIGKVMEKNERVCIYRANKDCVIQICEDKPEDYERMKE